MSEHPSLEDIALFVYGKSSDPRAVEQHIDQCSDCAAQVIFGREMRYMDSLSRIGSAAFSETADQHGGKESAQFNDRDVTSPPPPSSHRLDGAGRQTLTMPRRRRWTKMALAAAAMLLIGQTVAYVWQYVELRGLVADRTRLSEEEKQLRAENKELRAQHSSGGGESPLQYVAHHAPRPANWDMLLDNFYVPAASAEENLTQLSKVVDPAIQAEITRMQAQNQSAEQILKTLFSAYGYPKKK